MKNRTSRDQMHRSQRKTPRNSVWSTVWEVSASRFVRDKGTVDGRTPAPAGMLMKPCK